MLGLSPEDMRQMQRELRSALSSMSSETKSMQHRLTMVNEAIRQAEAPIDMLHVSDHALLRYLERVVKIDLEPHRAKLREIAAGRYDPTDEHEVVTDKESGAVLIIRGMGGGRLFPAIVTVLDSAVHAVPEKGQLTAWRDDDA